MTEPANKKSKEGRYRLDPNLIEVEVEPVVEPLTDLDSDEDAIDRLLINTGFDAETDFFSAENLDSDAWDKPLAAYDTRTVEFDALSDDPILATRQTGDDETIEPVDLGSPIADIELTPAPLQQETASVDALIEKAEPAPAEDDGFWAPDDPEAEFNEFSHAAFNLDEAIEPVNLDSPVAGINPTEAAVIDNAPFAFSAALFEPSAPAAETEPEPHRAWQGPRDDAAPIAAAIAPPAENGGDHTPLTDALLEQAIPPEVPADWSRSLSLQEDTGRQLAILEGKTRNAGRLSYVALALSLTALCAALTLGYLNVQTRAELSKLKTMTAILEEDMGGLSEKAGSNNPTEEDSEAAPSHFSEEPEPRTENKAIAAPPTAATEPAPAELAPKPALVSKDASPPVRKIQTPKPALNMARAKASEKPAASASGAKWTVNLAAFRAIADARKKATEFQRKGIAVKVMKVDIQHATWYRLAVPGFKTKEAASAHSTKLKKLLRLNSIWVAAL